jgi:hypothetical protein
MMCELPSRAVPVDIKTQTDDNIVTSNRSATKLAKEEDAICTSVNNYIAMTAKARGEKNNVTSRGGRDNSDTPKPNANRSGIGRRV